MRLSLLFPRVLLVVLLLCLAPASRAAITWSSPTVPGDYGAARASLAACSTGTESAPTDGVGLPAQGISLEQLAGLSVHLECAGAITAGSLVGYGYNPITGKWNPVTALTLPTTTGQYQAWLGISVLGPFSRVAWVPSGLGAVACSLYVFGAVVRR